MANIIAFVQTIQKITLLLMLMYLNFFVKLPLFLVLLMHIQKEIMKIISYNVNGIRAAITKGFIEWLHLVHLTCLPKPISSIFTRYFAEHDGQDIIIVLLNFINCNY